MLNLTDLMYSVHSFFFGNNIKDILKQTSNKNKIILDIGCYTGWFTKKMIMEEKKLNLYSKYYLFDPNPKSKLYLTNLMASNKNIEYFVKKPILETYCRNLENSVFERKVTNTKIKKIPVISNTNVLKSKNSIPKKEIINNPTAL